MGFNSGFKVLKFFINSNKNKKIIVTIMTAELGFQCMIVYCEMPNVWKGFYKFYRFIGY